MAEVYRSISRRVSQKLRSRRIEKMRRAGHEIPHDLRYAEIEVVHYYAFKNYRVRPFPGSLHLFRAEDQDERSDADATLGWKHVAANVEVFNTPGDHHVSQRTSVTSR